METAPMTFTIEMPAKEWFNHPLYMDAWASVPVAASTSSSPDSFPLFLKLEHNINVIDWEYFVTDKRSVMTIFESEQDYILWKLHQ